MSESQVLKRLDSPAYCIKVLDNGLVAIAGGGGKAKTGVGNLIEVGLIDYQLENGRSSIKAESEGHAKFKLINTFEPEDAIMKFVSFSFERDQESVASKKSIDKSKSNSSSDFSNGDKKAESASPNIDMYLAAVVNDTIEIYRLAPKVQKCHSESNGVNNNYNKLDQSTSHLKNRKGIIIISIFQFLQQTSCYI